MSTARRLLGQAVKATAAVADAVRRPPPGVVVLIYHRVGTGTGSEIDLATDTFAEQMAWLAQHRRPVDLDEALDLLERPEAPEGPPPVVVTFDDGTADFVDHALPVLARQRVPATLYLATDFTEQQRTFPPDDTPVTWSGLAEALSTGLVTVGSHTHTHALLDRLPADQVADELDRSVELIGERLGVTADHFAYPKAVPGSPAAADAVRQRFRSAALAGTRPNPYGTTDPQRLARSPIQVSDHTTWFRRKAQGGMAFEDGLRRALNRRRYAAATT
jgi:peptidoglycan/xylan/chitin deacetylase (PgdA/CDA1 family)